MRLELRSCRQVAQLFVVNLIIGSGQMPPVQDGAFGARLRPEAWCSSGSFRIWTSNCRGLEMEALFVGLFA